MCRIAGFPDALAAFLTSWRSWPWHWVLTAGLLASIVGMLVRPHGGAGLALALTAAALVTASAVAVTHRQEGYVSGGDVWSAAASGDADPDSGTAVDITAAPPAPGSLVPDTAWADFVINDIPEADW